MPEDPRICTHCGSTEWYINFILTRTTRNTYSIEENGTTSFDDSEEIDGNDDEGGEDGPYCSHCGCAIFLDLSGVDSSEIAELVSIEDSQIRIALARLLIEGKEIDWDQQAEKLPQHEDNPKRKFIGKKVIQR